MGLFTGIMNKIFGHKAEAKPQALAAMPPAPATAPSTPAPTSAEQPVSNVPPMSEPPPAPAAAAPPTPAPAPVVDVAAVLDDLATATKEKLDWRKSIVDLMKLVGMDSSLASRKELARELEYPGDTGDSAKMNVWLHREVIKKLAANGGSVPDDLLD